MTEIPHRPLSADGLVDQAQDIPTLPDIYFRVRQVLESPASTHLDVADVLGTDPGIAARLLRMANSAFYGRPNSIDTIARAVGLLGTQQVHDLVLATATVTAFRDVPREPLSPRVFWYASLVAGSAAKLLAERCNILDCERLFVAGLLAQIGQLVMLQAMPDVMVDLLHEAAESGQAPDALQRERIGFDYAEVSAALFGRWNLPGGLVNPVRRHTEPGRAGDNQLEAGILNIAVRLGAVRDGQALTTATLATIDPAALGVSRLSHEDVVGIHAAAVDLTSGVLPILLRAA